LARCRSAAGRRGERRRHSRIGHTSCSGQGRSRTAPGSVLAVATTSTDGASSGAMAASLRPSLRWRYGWPGISAKWISPSIHPRRSDRAGLREWSQLIEMVLSGLSPKSTREPTLAAMTSRRTTLRQ
jgi:hypothetical protein